MAMISFARDGKDAVVKLEALIPTWDTRVFCHSFGCGSEYAAGLLVQHLQKTLGDAVQAARREAYEQGWRDAKAKNGRCEYFKRGI